MIASRLHISSSSIFKVSRSAKFSTKATSPYDIADRVTPGGRSSVSGVIASVYGGTGFLGRYVVNGLGRIGSQIVVPFRGEEKSYTHLKVMGDLGQIVPLRWDIRDKDSIRRSMEHSNVVVNLVGSKWDTRNFSMNDVHVDGVRRIAEVAKELKVQRFVHVSSLGADENSDCDWLRTKAVGENVIREVLPSATILRPAPLWGLEDNLLNRAAQMVRYWPVYVLTNKDVRTQPTFVGDVAQAVVEVLKSRSSAGAVYELGGPEIITGKDFYEMVTKFLKRPKYTYEPSEEALWHLGYWLGQQRYPRFTLDSIKDKAEKLTHPNQRGYEQLGIEPESILSLHAMSLIQHYRNPSQISDISLGQTVPDIPGIERVPPNQPLY